ncbi:MAG TPA: hypothetical protein VIY48_17610 [Candidatus Paceibacterota bacterium]
MATELQEAITAASTVTPLIQKVIDPLLLEYQRRYAPLLAAIPSRQWSSTQYFFNRRTARPDSGGVIDGGARPIGNSTYEQNVFNIKLLQAVGSVTGFAQVVTRDLVGDLRQLEIDGTVTSLMWTMECDAIWGNDPATANGQYPIYSGLDYLVSNWTAGAGSSAYVNALDVNNNFTLARLDELIDLVESNAAMPLGSNYMFIMSPRMYGAVSQAVMPQQRFNAPTVQLAAGLNVPSYRDVPIVKSSFLAPRSFQMGTVTATASTGGSLTTGQTYRYMVSAVIARFGEIQVSAEASATPSGGNLSVSLTFSTPTNMPDGLAPILYKVYRTAGNGASGTESLLGVVDAFDTGGTAVTTIIDTGANLLTNSSGVTGPSAYVGTNTGALPRGAGQEDIYVVPRDANFMVRPYTRDVQVIPLAPTVTSPDTLPFALVSDTCLALRAPKYVGRLSRVVANI